MSEYVRLPDGFGELPPGPELGAALAAVDRSRCNGFQLVEVVQARYRQVGWEQAQLLADIHELAHAPYAAPEGPPIRQAWSDPHTAEEVSFALAITHRAAEDHLATAWQLCEVYPGVHGALAAGRIDLPKAKMLLREIGLLEPDEARAVLDVILADIEHRSYAAIRDSLRRLILRLGPDLVRRRYQASLLRRNVTHTEHSDGTASITANYLPKDAVAAVFDHLHRTTAAIKRASRQPGAPIPADPRTADQVRADLFLDLLRGVDPVTAGTAAPGPGQGAVHLTVELTTLMGLTDNPGELAGFGPVVADIARQLAQEWETGAKWRFQVTHDGRLIHEGRLHYRPTADQAAYVRARDKRCQAPHCRRPAHQCDIDHTRRWTNHGTTHEANLAVLCRRHHRAKDNGGFRVGRTDDGLVWITPRGRAYPVPLGRELTQEQRRLLQYLVTEGEKRRVPLRT